MKHIFETGPGEPAPLGVSKLEGSVNFAFYSSAEQNVSLVLFVPGEKTPFAQFTLNPDLNRKGNIWHIEVKKIDCLFDYGIQIGKEMLLDPYATCVNTGHEWANSYYSERKPLGRFQNNPKPFNWENDTPPLIPFQSLIIYEMHVRGFTQDLSSHVKNPGTFLAMIEKIPYLKELGVNAVELLPVFEFNECENPRINPETGEKLYNYWGYSTVNFFSLMNRYSTSSDKCIVIEEFKTLVKELHKNGIEVILDVVYNHTAEGNEEGPNYSFRGLDEKAYYILGPHGEYYNYTGCGNTFNCNNPIASDLIIDSLRYWVHEMHIDGFRFDLASILTRNEQGHPLQDPPVVRRIAEDPLLGNIKLIAEAWDAAGLYQVGNFPSYGRWAEWNGKYRDIVRKFIKGSDGNAGPFAGVLSGSQDLYNYEGKPFFSINFVTAHDGFSLRDLVSYSHKHNLANGENNQDGANDNESWNCGHEGPTTNAKILMFRRRQMKNFVVALMVAVGTPMMLMGDEYGHTHSGNNNTWCHDGQINNFLWTQLDQEKELFRFFKSMIAFRKNNLMLCRTEFLQPDDIDWHGLNPFQPDWSPASRFIAYTLKDKIKENQLYIAFNATDTRPTIHLPLAPTHKKWYRLVDTALATPHDYIDNPTLFQPQKVICKMEAYSSIILVAL
jgi:isoamylase/glycogen operon protein